MARKTKNADEPKATAKKSPKHQKMKVTVPAQKSPKHQKTTEATRRDLVQTSLNERNTAPDHANDRLFERIREVDPTVINKR